MAIADAQFRIYLVAQVDRSGNLNLSAPFDAYPIDFSGNTDDDWRILASTLEGIVRRDELPATDQGATDSRGTLRFPNRTQTLPQGLYLVMGSRHVQSDFIYEVEPFLVMLPTLDQLTDEWVYHVTARPKFDKDIETGGDEKEPVKRKVLKIWEDECHPNRRPREILVQLLRDGVVWDTVILNEENYWRYTWEELDAGHDWLVVEQVPDGYRVAVTRVGITFAITNSCDEPHPPTEPSEPTEPTSPTEPDKPSEPTTPTGPTKPSEPTSPTDSTEPEIPPEKLPQTGQLWWPVPVLLCAGVFLILMGVLRRRGTEYEE